MAESNRRDNIEYLWILPDGSMTDSKNPANLTLGYGQYDLMLILADGITEEISVVSLHIDHRPIPKALKKSTSVPSSNYTLDLKDVPQDMGGGGATLDKKTPLKHLILNLVVLALLAS